MKLKESLKRFWEALGEDYPEQEDTGINENPELQASLERVEGLENKFKEKQVSNKGKIVETIVIDPSAAAKMAEAAKAKKQAAVSKEDKQLGE